MGHWACPAQLNSLGCMQGTQAAAAGPRGACPPGWMSEQTSGVHSDTKLLLSSRQLPSLWAAPARAVPLEKGHQTAQPSGWEKHKGHRGHQQASPEGLTDADVCLPMSGPHCLPGCAVP